MSVKIYLCRGMTGRDKADVFVEAKEQRTFLTKAGFTILCPVAEEGVKFERGELRSTKKEMDKHWKRDKEMIREAHMVWDMTPHRKSEGCSHELGYARYCLWKPVVRVYPSEQLPDDGSVAYYEDDAITDSILEAIEYTLRVHGTFWRRLKWRAKMLSKSLFKWIWYQIREIK